MSKEWRELLATRSWWVLLASMGPLVGVSFIDAVNVYGEASGLNGTSAGVGEAFSPLVGIWAPTFSACELAAAFLLPFVAIRVVAGDRQSGALKLELQRPIPPFLRIGAKALVLLAGWFAASLPAAGAVALWKWYGGTVYLPELATVAVGHTLNAGLTIALAAATASIADHPATAAILTLGATVGTWIVNFIAAVHGGFWESAAAFTPTAMVAQFQHGLIRLDVSLIALALVVGWLALAAIWLRIGVAVSRRTAESLAAAAVVAAAVALCTFVPQSWDTSENRRNSFSRSEEAVLAGIRGLRIEAHLAAKDPRRADLEQHVFSKLRRVMPGLKIDYVSATSIGLFEQTNAHYGEIWYELGGRREMSRLTAAEGVLETIFALAGVPPPGAADAEVFRGHPLAARPSGAPLVFYGVWPVLVGAGFFLSRRLS
jgi:uncharacterized membrane protein YciS (DUF1049 family)